MNLFSQQLQQKPFLIIAHRGFWGGNIIQNTRQSVMLAFKAGADIAEIDVCRSVDGVYYLFHNTYEYQLLRKEIDFTQLTSDEIDHADVYNSVGEVSGYHIERLADFLAWLPSNYLINIDRAWHYFSDKYFLDLLEQSGKSEQLFLKSRLRRFDQILALNQATTRIQFMPIIESQEEYQTVLQCENLNIIGVELVIKQRNNDLLAQGWLSKLSDSGLIVIANAENLGVKNILHYGLNDDLALFEGEELAWGTMLNEGANALITHWPHFMYQYRQTKS